MNLLIIGGNGFLGKNCAQKLSENNKVFIADKFVSKDLPYDSLEINLTETDRLLEFIEKNHINAILHLASSLLPGSDFQAYCTDIQQIYNPTLTLLEYCSKKHIPFFFFSSGGTVYGNQKEIFNEKTKREPINYYGLSKLNLENTIEFYHRTQGLQYLIIRPSNPYGFGQNLYGKQGLISVVFGKIKKNETVEIWGDGSAIKDFIYIDDFVFYISALLNTPKLWNEIYNIGTGSGYSVNEVLEAFRQNKISLPEVKYIAKEKSDVSRMILDCTKLQEAVPHKCVKLQEGIRLFYNKLKENNF